MRNPYEDRVCDLQMVAAEKKLAAVVLFNEYNRLALTGVKCDNGCLVVGPMFMTFYTDFRYTVMAERTAPWLDTRDIWKPADAVKAIRSAVREAGGKTAARIGYEGSITARQYLTLQKAFPKAQLVDIERDVLDLRAVKTVDEITRIAAAEALNDEIWSIAQTMMNPGMTEKQIQRIIRALMNEFGDGEAFETIVCAGSNAAECHHVPDDTVWNKGEPLLVDMGVKLDGVCSDMTRNIKPSGNSKAAKDYNKIYKIVLEANQSAIAAAKPGMTGRQLDAIARKLITKAGYGKAFGHSLGHGVGFEIHESPNASPYSETVLEPGMIVTIEPGIYLPGELGIRIEDLVLITTTGCEVLSHSKK